MAFRDIIGQDKAVSILSRTLLRDRVPSAYLFAGDSGIGKKFTAVNFAKAVNCLANGEVNQQSPATDACDECRSCRKIDAGTHPDFMMVIPEKGEIRIDDIRAVEEALYFRPHEGRKKVVIVDDADTMNQPAANAFLKTLEEPPAGSLLILIASNPAGLPETIRSRCWRINFAQLSFESCEKVIRAAKSRGAAEADGAQLADVVRLSMGRPGLAVSSDLIKERERFISLLKGMAGLNNETWTDRDEMEQWLQAAGILMRDLAVLNITGEESMLMSGDVRTCTSGMKVTRDLRDVAEAFKKIMLLSRQLGFNLNTKITWNYTASVMKAVICSN